MSVFRALGRPDPRCPRIKQVFIEHHAAIRYPRSGVVVAVGGCHRRAVTVRERHETRAMLLCRLERVESQ
eukprot:1725964-Prymnesium_polylepis.3